MDCVGRKAKITGGFGRDFLEELNLVTHII